VTDILVPEPEGAAALLARIETDLSNIKEDTRHIKVRLTSLDANMSSLNRHMGHCGVPARPRPLHPYHPGRREAAILRDRDRFTFVIPDEAKRRSGTASGLQYRPPGNRIAIVRETGGFRAGS
jgi:hypothetical protein